MEKEIRILEQSGVTLRAEGEGDEKKYFAEGYALLFNHESKNLGGFTEMIDPKALDDADMSDIIARTHHNDEFILGRTKSGTLKVKKDKKGLFYSVELADTTAGRDLRVNLQRGDITESSFAFTIDYDNDGSTWVEREDDNKVPLRKITKFKKIYDVSPVVVPAYDGTSVGVAKRSLEEFFEAKNKDIEAEKEAERRKLEIIQTNKQRIARCKQLQAII